MNTLSKIALTLILATLGATLSSCNRSDLTGSPFSDSPNQNFDGIIGGVEVQPADPLAKHTVILWNRYVKGAVCTATLLDHEYAVTAAHCVELFGEDAFLLGFGTKVSAQTVARPVVSIKLLPSRAKYIKDLIDVRDLALVKFVGGLPEGFEGVAILTNDQLPLLKASAPVTVAGYGVDQWNSGSTPSLENIHTLRKVQLNIWNPDFARSEILLDQRHGKAACRGDSGGPAFIEFEGQQYFWGIASRGTHEDGTGLRSNECSEFVVYTNAIIWMPALRKLRTPTTPEQQEPTSPTPTPTPTTKANAITPFAKR